MSVRVNLLPREFEERTRQRRMIGVGVLVVFAWVALLAVVLLSQLGAVDAAREERDAAQAEVNRLQAEVNALGQFQQLASQLEATNTILATAMGEEVSWARVLNNIALAVPTTTSLVELNGSLTGTQANPQDVFVETEREDVGFLTLNGYSTERFAPGVEAILIRFGEVDSFFQQYLTSALAEELLEVGVTSFTAEVRLNDANQTGRYTDGLPEVQQ